MIRTFTIALLLLISLNVKSQIINWDWAVAGGGVEGRNVAVDANENIYLAGNSGIGTDSFGSGVITCTGGLNGCAYLAKYDSSGNFIWAKGEIGPGNGYAIVRALAADAFGYVYVGGEFTDTVVFDPDTLRSPTGGAFITKYDSSGNVIWTKGFPSIGILCLAIDNMGKVYATGTFSTTVTLGASTLTSAGSIVAYIMKCDASGNVLWAQGAGSTDLEDVRSIALDPSANAYIAGMFRSPSASFGSSTLTNPANVPVPFLAKCDSSGIFDWARSGDVNQYSNGGWAVAVDRYYHVYFGGFFNSHAISFDTVTLVRQGGGSNVFIARYDTAGNIYWAKKVYPTGSHQPRAEWITTDRCGRVFLAGSYGGPGGFYTPAVMIDSIQVDCPVCYGVITSDPTFIAAYDSMGNVLFARGLSSGGDDEFCLASSPSGSLYVGGDYFSQSHPFIVGTDTFPAGQEIPFLARLTMPNCFCNVEPPEITQNGDTLSVPNQYASYQWIHNGIAVAGATNSFFIATGSGSYLVVVTDSGNCVVGARVSDVVASIESPDDKGQINIYPNPTQNTFTIANSFSKENMVVEILNVFGESVYRRRFYGETEIIIDAGLASGIYFARIGIGKISIVKKVVVE